MCKPGSACCGCGVSCSGMGMAVAVLGAAGAVSMVVTFAGAILTAALIIVFGAAAAMAVILVTLLSRTRGAVTWPMRISRPPAAARRAAPVPGRVLPVAARPARAIALRPPLAIEAPPPGYVRAGLPTGLSGPAARWLPVRWPGSVLDAPAPEAVLASGAGPDRPGLAAAEVTPGHDVPPDGQPARPHYV